MERRISVISPSKLNAGFVAGLLLACVPILAAGAEPVSYPSTESSPAWAIADFNGDSRPDVIFAIEQGLGSGGYEHRVELTLSGSPTKQKWPLTFFQTGVSISTRDIDWDGDLDLVFENVRSRTSLSVWLNDGSGLFRQTQPGFFDQSVIWQEPGFQSRRKAKRPLTFAERGRHDSYAVQVSEISLHSRCDAFRALSTGRVPGSQTFPAYAPRAPPVTLS